MTPLVLRDVHEGVAPAWWPPAPGWWVALAVLSMVVLGFAWRAQRRRRQRAALLRLFDDALAQAGTPAQEVAAMSEVLRRAARRKNPQAATWVGAEWLRFLDDGMPQPVFSAGAGALLEQGGFRPDVAAHEVEALREIVRQRYLVWMQGA